MRQKQIIKQVVNGVEKLLVVEVVEEINVPQIKKNIDELHKVISDRDTEIEQSKKQIEELSAKIEYFNTKIEDCIVERNATQEEVKGYEDILNGILPEEVVEEVKEGVKLETPVETPAPTPVKQLPPRPFRRGY